MEKTTLPLLLRVCPLKVVSFSDSKFFTFDILFKLYFALVVPHFDYCITIILWGNSPSSHTDILQKLQNRLASIITENTIIKSAD